MTTNINSFRDLFVWQKSMDLAVRCYRTAQRLPNETQLEIGARLEIISPEEAQFLIDDAQEIGRMINGLVKSLERGEPQHAGPARRR